MPPAKAKGERFEHGSVLGGKTRSARVSSQWKSTGSLTVTRPVESAAAQHPRDECTSPLSVDRFYGIQPPTLEALYGAAVIANSSGRIVSLLKPLFKVVINRGGIP